MIAAEPAEKKLEKAIRDGLVRRYHGIDWFADAEAKGVITAAEAEQLREVESSSRASSRSIISIRRN